MSTETFIQTLRRSLVSTGFTVAEIIFSSPRNLLVGNINEEGNVSKRQQLGKRCLPFNPTEGTIPIM